MYLWSARTRGTSFMVPSTFIIAVALVGLELTPSMERECDLIVDFITYILLLISLLYAFGGCASTHGRQLRWQLPSVAEF